MLNILNSVPNLTKDKFNNAWLALQDNLEFRKFFAVKYPSATLIHELSHAWRKSSHGDGSHTDIDIKIGNRPSKSLTFDEAANGVALQIFSENFIDKMWMRLTNN
jgi:hypothetical protein